LPTIIFLDSGPIGLACGNPAKPAILRFRYRLELLLSKGGFRFILPEIVDYEIRRKLLTLPHGSASIERLDRLTSPGGPMIFAPLRRSAMLRAAELWAQAWKAGYRTADDQALDGDVILAAQALDYTGLGDRLIIATENVEHLSRYVGNRARNWDALTP
jgi:predicted nucleic acid-binding protein